MSKFKIAVDISWLGKTGIGRVASEILRRCPPYWSVIEIGAGKKNASPFAPFNLSLEIIRSKADLFWSPGYMPPIYTGGIPSVITLHDLTHLYYYKFYHRIYYELVIKNLLKHITTVVTVSDFSRNELLSWSGLNAGHIRRIYNGVSCNFLPNGTPFNISRPYILYVGNRREYKNIYGLMGGFAKSGLANSGYVLALSGDLDEACLRMETSFGLGGSVIYLGVIDEDNLASVYCGATALAFLSKYEGFGLPILEAMACGVPVITSNVTSMPEISGGNALLVDPSNLWDIACGLVKICGDANLRARLIQGGIQHAKKFSWDTSASQYWNLFLELLKVND